MSQLIVLEKDVHGQLRLDSVKARSLLANQPLVSVVISEFLKLAIHFPIVIVKQADTGRFGCSALMGLDRDENLFLADSAWQGLYWPAQIRRQPFQVGQSDGALHLCFNPSHPALSRDKGEALFNQGSDAQCLVETKAALAELVNGEQPTQEFLQRLESLSLLTPLQLEITGDDNKPHKLTGLYSVDDRKLDQLKAEDLLSLQKAGYLASIYTLLASHGHIYELVQMKSQARASRAA